MEENLLSLTILNGNAIAHFGGEHQSGGAHLFPPSGGGAKLGGSVLPSLRSPKAVMTSMEINIIITPERGNPKRFVLRDAVD